MSAPSQMPPVISLLGAPVPSRHNSPDAVPTAGGFAMGGQANQDTRAQREPQGGNPAASGECCVTGEWDGTGGARVTPVPDAVIISAFRSGFDTVSIADLFQVAEWYVWNALARRTPR